MPNLTNKAKVSSQDEIWSIPEDLFLLRPANFGVISGVWHPDSESIDNLISKLLLPIIVMFLFVLFGVGIIFEDVYLLILKTETTTGEVFTIESYQCGSKRRETCYRIQYRYPVGTTVYFDTLTLTTNPNLIQGDSIAVTYSAINPEISTLGKPYLSVGKIFMIVFVVVFIGIDWIVIQALMSDERRYRREGFIIYGQLLSVTSALERNEFWITVHYEFMTLDGQSIRKSATRRREDLRSQTLPKSGTVAVQYVDKSLYRLL